MGLEYVPRKYWCLAVRAAVPPHRLPRVCAPSHTMEAQVMAW